MRLRYFDARGRAQFLRAWLRIRDIAFEDDRVPLEGDFASWMAVRDDRSLNGPLKKLPVLFVDNRLIPETLVIASYLHNEFGDNAHLTTRQNEHHDVILSCVYVDVMLTLGTLIWADLLYEGVNMHSLVRSMQSRLNRTLMALDRTLDEWQWVARMHQRPVTVADCLLWEELDKAVTTFGSNLTLDDKPALLEFRSEHPGRRLFERQLADSPCQITGRPGEARTILDIQNLLADEVSLAGSNGHPARARR